MKQEITDRQSTGTHLYNDLSFMQNIDKKVQGKR